MHAQPQALDGLFAALSDPTRRQVLERLAERPASVSDLARPFEMALPSFLQHLKVLEGCGLVRSQKSGRVRTYELAPERLAPARDWLDRQRAVWQRRLDSLDAYVLSLKEGETP